MTCCIRARMSARRCGHSAAVRTGGAAPRTIPHAATTTPVLPIVPPPGLVPFTPPVPGSYCTAPPDGPPRRCTDGPTRWCNPPTEDALRASEARLRTILDTAVDAFITINDRG